jgi:uncharacterized protein (DUF58 family)
MPEEIYARNEFPLKLNLENHKRFLPAFLIRLKVFERSILFPFIDKKGCKRNYIMLQLNERGRYKIPQARFCSVFPFNFFSKCYAAADEVEFIVFPQMKKCALSGFLEKQRRTAGDSNIPKTGYDSEPLSIRDYARGDHMKYIHWKASAKTGKLKTKELSSLSYQPVVIDFDAVEIKNTEEKISCISYIINDCYKRGIPIGLRINGEFHKEGLSKPHKINMLKALALYGKDN